MTASAAQEQEDVNAARRRDDARSETAADRPRPAKRARVALACQRCKTRKQKCDGQTPTCANCWNFNASCKYVKPPKQISYGRDQYFKATEDRVAELEAILLREGIADEGQSQWHRLRKEQNWDSSEQADSRVPESRPGSAKRPVSNSPPNDQNGTDEESEAGVKEKQVNSVVDILRDLSLEASGGYIGASSSITMSRMVGSFVRGKEGIGLSGNEAPAGEHLSPKSTSDGTDIYESAIETGGIAQGVADRLLKSYLKHISTRWPVLHSAFVQNLHSRRESLSTSYEKSVLHLVYAIGGRFLETTGETGAFFAERHQSAGMQYLDEIMQYHNASTVQVLILLAIYSLRAPKGPGAWTYIGLAMRTCIDIGLHRRVPGRRCSLFDAEMGRRIFWTCYCLDRQVSIVLGRPFAISDRDIDAELPLDVDECCQDISVMQAAQQASICPLPNGSKPKSTSMACFIHICRLRRIESQIQQGIYRVDQPAGAQESGVEMFISQLEDWKANIPSDARHPVSRESISGAYTTVVDGYDYYMVYYYKCLRFLLHPHISTQETNGRFLKKCAEACGGVCQTYKRLHQNIPIGFSLMALHSVFLAGLTLVYYTWISPEAVFSITTSNDMNACSIVLYIITERWPGAKKYRDTYEAVKQSVLDSVEEGKCQPRRTIPKINPDVFQTIDRNEEGRIEVSRMVAEMSGQPLSMDEDNDFVPLLPSLVPDASTAASALSPGLNGYNFTMPLDATLDFHQHARFEDSMMGFNNSDVLDGFGAENFNMGTSQGMLGGF